MKAQGYLDLHWGMKPTGWMMHPLSLDTWEREHFLWRNLETMRISQLQPLAPKRWPWKAQNVTFYALDITWARVLMGFLMVDGDVAWFDGERDTWHALEHLVA
jgi:hypothetical protein